MPEIGQTISHYRILTKLGQGGMGEVFLAIDTPLDRKVALKFLPGEMRQDKMARERLLREAKSAAALDHPYICHIHEVGRADDNDFIAMEYVEGQTLKDRLETGRLSLQEALRTAMEITEALEKAHQSGIVHRDLKPSNIMLAPDGHAKVMDFGLAKHWESSECSQNEIETALTGEGRIPGTPAYMSPEQLRSRELDTRSDIFSFGVVVYEMLTGVHPFRGKVPVETANAILSKNPPPMSRYAEALPEGLEHIVVKMLAKEPEGRYQLIQEVRADLTESGDSRSSHKLSKGFPRLVPLTVALIILLFSLVAITWWVRENYFQSPQTVLAFEERDWILIADFQNQTGDEIFDNSLITAFTVGLAQSRYANVYPESRVRETLKRMKEADTQKIGASLAQEIALREGIKALVIPGITGIGENYRLTASIRDPVSAIDVKVESVEAAGKGEILDALDTLTRKVRINFGESMEAISQSSKPLAKVTTSSLRALRLYTSAAEKNNFESKYEEAEILFKEALEADPGFASAKAALGMIQLTRLGKQEEGGKLLAEAVKNADDLIDTERYTLLAWHAANVEQDLGSAERYEKALVTLYPDLSEARNNLGLTYMRLGRYEEAVAEFDEVIRINPYQMIASSNLIIIYLHRLGYMDTAIEICKRQIAVEPQYEWAYCNMGWAQLGKGNLEQAQAAFEKALEINSRNTVHLWRLAHAQRLRGLYQDALKSLERILEIDQADFGAHYNLGVVHRLLGNADTALKHFGIFRREAEEWVREDTTNGRNYITLALVLARMGEKERSLSLGEKAMAMVPCNATEPLIGRIDMWGGFTNLCDFDYALLLSVQGRKQEAMDRLEVAIGRGYRDYVFMKIHPDLQNLYGEPRFQELVDRVLHK